MTTIHPDYAILAAREYWRFAFWVLICVDHALSSRPNLKEDTAMKIILSRRFLANLIHVICTSDEVKTFTWLLQNINSFIGGKC